MQNVPDKKTTILEQRAFQDGIGAPVEQPLPGNPVIKKLDLTMWYQIHIEAPILPEGFMENNLIMSMYISGIIPAAIQFMKYFTRYNTKMNT